MVTVIEDAGSPARDWSAHGLAVTARWSADPARDEVRAALRGVDDEGVLVSGSAATLGIVVDGLRRAGALHAPVGFLPAAATKGPDGWIGGSKAAARRRSNATLDLAERFGLAEDVPAALRADPVELPLARNDIGGVLLGECVFERPRLAKFGAQAYHDDQLISDGLIRGLSVLPEYGQELTLRAICTPASGRKRTTTTYGRAVQLACEPVRMWVDGRDCGEVEGRTWYVDDRETWLLRGARPAEPPQRTEGSPWLERLWGRRA